MQAREATDSMQDKPVTKTIIIAEKPSVAQDIVRALGTDGGKFDKQTDHFENDKYVVTSAVGHLVEIKAPEEYDVKRGKWSFVQTQCHPRSCRTNYFGAQRLTASEVQTRRSLQSLP